VFEMDGRLVSVVLALDWRVALTESGERHQDRSGGRMKEGGAGGRGKMEKMALGVKKRARGMTEGKRTRAKQEAQRRKPKPEPPKNDLCTEAI